MKTAFISGHRDITEAEFNRHYVPLLDEALAANHHFVVGDYHGADIMAQRHLKEKGATAVVYHMFAAPRNHAGFPTRGAFTSDESRDAAMTLASDYDIAWLRPGKDQSGTAQNLRRRTQLAKAAFKITLD